MLERPEDPKKIVKILVEIAGLCYAHRTVGAHAGVRRRISSRK
jgi:hypothetical protein